MTSTSIRLFGNAIIGVLLILTIIALIIVTFVDEGKIVMPIVVIITLIYYGFKVSATTCEEKDTLELISLALFAIIGVLYTSGNVNGWIFGVCVLILIGYNGYRWNKVRFDVGMEKLVETAGNLVMGQGLGEGGAFAMPNFAGILAKVKSAKEKANTSYQKLVGLNGAIGQICSVQSQIVDPAAKAAVDKLCAYNGSLTETINLLEMIRTLI